MAVTMHKSVAYIKNNHISGLMNSTIFKLWNTSNLCNTIDPGQLYGQYAMQKGSHIIWGDHSNNVIFY